MSSFKRQYLNKETGEYETIHGIDDYFTRYEFGYKCPDGEVLTSSEFSAKYERGRK